MREPGCLTVCCGALSGFIIGGVIMVFIVLPMNHIASIEGELNKVNTAGLDQAVEDW